MHIINELKTKEEAKNTLKEIKKISYRGLASIEDLTNKEQELIGTDFIDISNTSVKQEPIVFNPEEEYACSSTVCQKTSPKFLELLNENYNFGKAIVLTKNKKPFALMKNWEYPNLVVGKTCYQRINGKIIFPLVKGTIYAFSASTEGFINNNWEKLKNKSNEWSPVELDKIKEEFLVGARRMVARPDLGSKENLILFDYWLTNIMKTNFYK